MLFSSPAFLVFFCIYFLFHFLVPQRFRIYLIIVGGGLFYAWWRIEYAWLPFLLTAIAHIGTIFIDKASDAAGRKLRTIATLIALFAPLAIYKYTDFVYREIITPLIGKQQNLLNLPLPLGISFISFTLAAYVIDVYRKRFPSGSPISMVLAYVLFFPHLIAGPILRPTELLPQLAEPRVAKLRGFSVALAIFSLGLVKKLMFADQIGKAIAPFYDQPHPPGAMEALLAIYGFCVQVYCDFSGYTDMAIGLALAIGVELPHNFHRPYSARSLNDLWGRWHITLSFWFRDYLFLPLGGYRNGGIASIRNIMLTMLLSGLWHGANWTFLAWGILHGIGLSINYLFRAAFRGLPRMPAWLAVTLTFNFWAFTIVFFRSTNIEKALAILSAPFCGNWTGFETFAADYLFTIGLTLIFFILHRFDEIDKLKRLVSRLRPEFTWAAITFAWVISIAVSQGNSAAFIYFDF